MQYFSVGNLYFSLQSLPQGGKSSRQKSQPLHSDLKQCVASESRSHKKLHTMGGLLGGVAGERVSLLSADP